MAFDGAFWNLERERLVQLFVTHLRESVIDGALSANIQMLEVSDIGTDWQLINREVQSWVERYGGTVSDMVLDTERDIVKRAINDWIEAGDPLPELIKTLEPLLGPGRATMIATTEVTGAFFRGNIAVWKQHPIVKGWVYHNAQDKLVCPICIPLEGEHFPLDEKKHAPPRHPRCRCWAHPDIEEPE